MDSLIDFSVNSFIKLNKGLVAFSYLNKYGYPIVEPKFIVEINEYENYICFFESKKDKADSIKNSKSVSISIFDWSCKSFDGYQLKGTTQVFSNESAFFKDILKKFKDGMLTPDYLNDFVKEMEINKIIPEFNYIIRIDVTMKYSLAPSSESAKPLVFIKKHE
ncbi:MAG: hypothetical protein ACK4F9_04310 [Brevinematia bacterium]